MKNSNLTRGGGRVYLTDYQGVSDSNAAKKSALGPDRAGQVNLNARQLLQVVPRDGNGNVKATRAVFKPTVTQGPLLGKTIIINAGHGYGEGATDAGRLGEKGLEDEWLLNYDNAMRQKDQLCALGATVIFLQGKKELICDELAKPENKADLFLSVHVNSTEDKEIQDRTEFFYSDKQCDANKNSRKLAKLFEQEFDSWIPKNEKIANADMYINGDKQDYAKTEQAGYAVIRSAEQNQNVPSILWEVGYMNSPKGRERLNNPKLMDDYSRLMANAIIKYFQKY